MLSQRCCIVSVEWYYLIPRINNIFIIMRIQNSFHCGKQRILQYIDRHLSYKIDCANKGCYIMWYGDLLYLALVNNSEWYFLLTSIFIFIKTTFTYNLCIPTEIHNLKCINIINYEIKFNRYTKHRHIHTVKICFTSNILCLFFIKETSVFVRRLSIWLVGIHPFVCLSLYRSRSESWCDYIPSTPIVISWYSDCILNI